MNPDCEPNSPGDVVLLFDTQPGWNQHGGAELLAPENHRGKNCNILFNDGTVKFIKKKHFDHLRWK
jgi:prepilin-type processing-associated H-X9-DG protein